jgi:hypothetical protein
MPTTSKSLKCALAASVAAVVLGLCGPAARVSARPPEGPAAQPNRPPGWREDFPIRPPRARDDDADRRPEGQADYPAEASRVHVIYLVYNAGGAFGRACQSDVDGFRATLEDGFGTTSGRLVHHDWTRGHPEKGRPYSLEELKDFLRNLRLGRNDTVVVFQSGHGCIGDLGRPEDSQYLGCTNGTPGQPGQRVYELRRGWLMSTLQAARPRALIVLTDCCSKYQPRRDDGFDAQHGFSHAPPGVNGGTVRQLFLRAVGVVSITGADDGECSIVGYSGSNPGKAGSAFTVALLRLMYDPDRTYQSWQEFFPALRRETFRASSGRPSPAHQARAFRLPGGEPAAER